ncbi:MAG TPA: DUF2147 domain-containing protein [Prolixibacteraceae bacterium]|nr:DUF2147 domain-containing protein [Bacteroidales bacterium]HPB05529.1 DUF2147 domain-containing protein [Prolixibacteraceae bacterium]HQN94484.1 DUF2147 domain-containing protein [Prolixibacteraceae bacterium]HUM89074.1 DUF2147 domain-containing protein [Prolixibacteraceae bacterium]
MRKAFLMVVLAVVFVFSASAAGIEGKWKTIDDETGKEKSVVELSIKDGKLYGKIVKLFNPDPNYDPVCTECKDHLKGKKKIGMQIVNGLSLAEGKWARDKGILDPENGKYYDVKMWVDEKDASKLNVRGYIGFLYRTQTWIRVE